MPVATTMRSVPDNSRVELTNDSRPTISGSQMAP